MNSIKVDGISMSFQNLLAKICFHHHFSGEQCHSDSGSIKCHRSHPDPSQSLPTQGLPLSPQVPSPMGPSPWQPGKCGLTPHLFQLWSVWTLVPPCTAAPSRATMSACW